MSGNPLRIAVVEDDLDLRDNMTDFLEDSGFSVWGVGSATALYRQMLVKPVDVVILDIGLPGEDGFSIARHLSRMPDLALIIVSARIALDDRLTGLASGADLYLTKPVDLRELVANIHAVTRRRLSAAPAAASAAASSPAGAPPVAAANVPAAPGTSGSSWCLDTNRWELISPEGKRLTLTAKEYHFLLPLAEAGGEMVSKATIAAKLGNPDNTAAEYNRIDVLLARLRKKSLQAFGHALPVKTITAYGYALSVACRLG
ncbi:MAG: response regulator transcription factor [Betaproteobacteria bacterium]|nr:response regulator transcription factor [Betaproteobacteria bacterium]